jgi:hypothetical protein
VRARRDTHASTTDPEARLYRKGKGKEAMLSYVGNALTENRHELVVEAELGTATGTIERGTTRSRIEFYFWVTALAARQAERRTPCRG